MVLDRAARGAGFDGPISMLFPYLLPLQAAKFALFARVRGLDLELTNECYVTLFGATEGRITCVHPDGPVTVFAEGLHAPFGMQHLEGKLTSSAMPVTGPERGRNCFRRPIQSRG